MSSPKAAQAKATIITEPGGDIEALYAAVYDEHGAPRNNLDIAAYDALSLSDEPGGDSNEVKVIIQNDNALRLKIDTHNCFPEASFSSCTNVAIVHD